MARTKRALITGITGQDGSYLAEFLLTHGYEVIGMLRRSSTVNFERINHFQNRITLTTADLLDEVSLINMLREFRPAEVYNLAAQSFVQTSWGQPVFTGEVTALGVTRMLDAIRIVDPDIRFYQASSSEMFGKVVEVPQRETTPFYPRSPYGVAKVYGHWITVNYRESYGMHASSGMLFNHECIAGTTPLIIRRGTAVDVVAAEELVPVIRAGRSPQSFVLQDVDIWDGEQWTVLRAVTATRRRATDPDHQMLAIHAPGGVVMVTAHHHMLDANREILPAHRLQPGKRLALAARMPDMPAWTIVTPECAEFLGLLAAAGEFDDQGRIQVTSSDPALRERVTLLWSRLALGETSNRVFPPGYAPDREGHQVSLSGNPAFAGWLHSQIYKSAGLKRVPQLVLNAGPDVQAAFLTGYFAGSELADGYGSVTTNSAVLAQGLLWLSTVLQRACSITAGRRGESPYYQIRFGTGEGAGQRKDPAEVRSVSAIPPDDEWVYDLETESGVFCAGVGRIVVHNSPRRGLEFVTRKITHAVARIKLGLETELRLGNLDAQRDWGFAGDYVKAMWLMLQQDEPDDYVVATGQTQSVRRFCELAFGHVGLDYRDYVVQDERFFRPAEVDLLVGDPTKANERLGWRQETSFEQLVTMMVEADLKAAGG